MHVISPSTCRETPPRAWGRHGVQAVQLDKPRNTPTSVGKTNLWPGEYGAIRKHPHERGEDMLCTQVEIAAWETPPRAWGRPITLIVAGVAARNTPTSVGKTVVPDPINGSIRNTPTSVGKTQAAVRKKYGIGKHPHERGEDHRPQPEGAHKWETPPRAWGRQRQKNSCGLKS